MKKILLPVGVLLLILILLLMFATPIGGAFISMFIPAESGWQEIDGATYYYDDRGNPLLGWQEIDSAWYYFSPGVDSYGAMHTGWLSRPEGRYYLGSDGIMCTQWAQLDGKMRYFGNDGLLRNGWTDIEEKRYYFNEDGCLQTGWLEQNGNQYYLGSDGAMVTGWLEADGYQHYLDEAGVLQTGWTELDGKTCYLDPTVGLHKGWLELDDGRYYLDGNGAMVTGWLELDGHTYYLKEDGTTASGRLELDGQTHYFTANGERIYLVNRWNPLPEDYEAELLDINTWHQIAGAEALENLNRMLADCTAAGYRPHILSSYRTQATQRILYETQVQTHIQEGQDPVTARQTAATIVALPGTSEHHLGLALDITDALYQKLDYDQEKTGTQKWLMEHCWEYGFILRYPNGKSKITGIIYEPWHYRYVGTETALQLRDMGVCLEEYLDMLTNDGTTCGAPQS